MTGAVLLALLPVVLLTGLGFALRRRRFLAEGFWPQAERLGYFVLLPSLFFHSLATAHVETVPVGALALTLILSTVIVAGLVIALRPLIRVDGPAFTSVGALVTATRAHHERRAEEIHAHIARLVEPTAYELSRAVFPHIDGFEILLAISEVLGHVDLLVADGDVVIDLGSPTRYAST